MVSMATHYAILKNGSVPTNILISQQYLILEYYTWYQIKAETFVFYSLIRYANYLICILMDIYEINRNERKDQEI